MRQYILYYTSAHCHASNTKTTKHFSAQKASFISLSSLRKKDQHSFIFKYCHRPLIKIFMTGNNTREISTSYHELTVTRVC